MILAVMHTFAHFGLGGQYEAKVSARNFDSSMVENRETLSLIEIVMKKRTGTQIC